MDRKTHRKAATMEKKKDRKMNTEFCIPIY